MLLELTKPVALVLCLASLLAVFYTAFLAPSGDLEQTIWRSTMLLSLAAGICFSSGMIFREHDETVLRTLPVQLFCWAACGMLVLFLSAWYLETHCIFYRDVRRF
jgi:hypothetical protein